MNHMYLPDIQSIQIKNFTLYPGDSNFNYEFVNGINLIVGGNGMGKTTLVNLIRFSIIGHYKEGFDMTRTYKSARIEKRTAFPWNYYRNRASHNNIQSGSPTVIARMKIDETSFEIERLLNEITIQSLKVDGEEIIGTIVSQSSYDQMCYDHSRTTDEALKSQMLTKIRASLPNKYEKAVEAASNMGFDDLIFFVNKILYFGEDHKTILWNNDSYADVQTELFNKYFNDRALNEKRQESNRQAKYYDTQARHRSEDIRVIRSVLEKARGKDDVGKESDINEEIENLKIKLDGLNVKIESIQASRNQVEADVRLLNNRINSLSQEADFYERNQKELERRLIQSNWITLNQSYDLYLKSLLTNEICPMCSQELADEYIRKISLHQNNCFLCEQKLQINSNAELSNEEIESQTKINQIYSEINMLQRDVYRLEKDLADLDKKFRIHGTDKRQLASKLRILEYDSLKTKGNDSNIGSTVDAFYDEISRLELEKEELQEKSRNHKEIANNISQKIDEQIIKNARAFSSLFSGYAEKFLGVSCSLTFEELNGQKRFYPVIDDKVREDEEELSESQRFFVDHAFRMSILSFFYNKPSFYIIETPGSSLDISYERNAADVFNKFTEAFPYNLILTTNLNNSEFLDYLIKTSKSVGIVDLLKIGRKSPIQDSNSSLHSVYNKLIQNIDEK